MIRKLEFLGTAKSVSKNLFSFLKLFLLVVRQKTIVRLILFLYKIFLGKVTGCKPVEQKCTNLVRKRIEVHVNTLVENTSVFRPVVVKHLVLNFNVVDL